MLKDFEWPGMVFGFCLNWILGWMPERCYIISIVVAQNDRLAKKSTKNGHGLGCILLVLPSLLGLAKHLSSFCLTLMAVLWIAKLCPFLTPHRSLLSL